MTEAVAIQAPRPPLLRRLLRWSPTIVAILILIGLAFVPEGLTGLDETVYFAGAQAFWKTGSFVVENGLEGLGYDQVRLYVMVIGPHGLVPQYPVGTFVLGAGMMELFGFRGLIIVNGLAAIGTLFATRALARRLFKDDLVADLAPLLLAATTFWLELAFAVWPHSTSIFCVTMALLYALRALDDDKRWSRDALVSGAFIGLGLLFRVDTLLLAPGIGLVAILFARRPVWLLVNIGLGSLPLLALSAWGNWEKFGTLNPITYGKDGNGYTSITAHLPAAAILTAACLALLAWRAAGFPRPKFKVGALTLAVLLAAALAVPFTRDIIVAYVRGAWAMVVDIRTVVDTRSGVEYREYDVVTFWGHVKQALAQSSPWLGGFLFLAALTLSRAEWRSLRIVGIVFFMWSFPLFVLSWHGGPGNGQRYLGPMIPLVCAAGAFAVHEIWRASDRRGFVFGVGALLGMLAIMAVHLFHPGGFYVVRQPLASAFFVVMVIASAIAVIRPGDLARRVQLAALGATMVSAYFSALTSMAQDYLARYENAAYSENFADIPGRSIVFGGTALLQKYGFKEDRVVLQPSQDPAVSDLDMIEAAFRNGYDVYLFPWMLNDDIRAMGYRIIETPYRYDNGALLKLEEPSSAIRG